jgi:hypothetical protein
MNLWIVFGVLIGIVLIVVLLHVGRPRTAQESLDRRTTNAATAPSPTDVVPVRARLEALVNQRATGILTVTAGAETASLCLLFGHVFHASAGTLQGEAALRAALAWPGASSRFETKTKLPTTETITRPTRTVLAELPPGPGSPPS